MRNKSNKSVVAKPAEYPFGTSCPASQCICDKFCKIIIKELELKMNPLQLSPEIFVYKAELFFYFTCRLLEVAENGTVLRCGNNIGHLTDAKIAYESDGAHANLVRAIVNYALDFIYGWDNDSPTYTRREMDEAAMIHDLCENVTGDSPDNHNDPTQKAIKNALEHSFFRSFLKHYDTTTTPTAHYYIEKLLDEMRTQTSEEGRILYLADKLAAIIMELCLDRLGLYPHAYPHDSSISDINREEMKMCDYRYQDGYLLSEMWANDFLFARELVRFDDTGFFTAILVMASLIAHNNSWYDWREEHYLP